MDETDDHFQIRLVDGAARGRYVSGCFKAADVSYDVQILLSFHRLKKKTKGSDGADFLLMFVAVLSSKINVLPFQKMSRIQRNLGILYSRLWQQKSV